MGFPIYYRGLILFRGGLPAFSTACCCDPCPKECIECEGNIPTFVVRNITGTSGDGWNITGGLNAGYGITRAVGCVAQVPGKRTLASVGTVDITITVTLLDTRQFHVSGGGMEFITHPYEPGDLVCGSHPTTPGGSLTCTGTTIGGLGGSCISGTGGIEIDQAECPPVD